MSIERLVKEFAEIGIQEGEPGRNSIALTDAEDRTINFAEQKAEKLLQEHGKQSSDYEITTDAFGSLYITLYGKDRTRTIMSGSHSDSVKNGGMYDGPVGVATAMQFLEKLLDSKQEPACNYTVVVFRSEESSPTTGLACLGSAIATGQITEQKLTALKYKKPDGTSVPLSEYFSERYGAKRWAAVLEELKNPPLNSKTIGHYEEVHIEQSTVTDLNSADVGIVAEGIGGSRRETIQVPSADLKFEETISTATQKYERVLISITGRADHTGGAPHNGTDVSFGAKEIAYRKNALLEAARVIEELVAPYYGGPAKVISIDIPSATGFTTVPAKQKIELVIPAGKQAETEKRLKNQQNRLQEEGMEFSYDIQSIAAGTNIRTIDSTSALAATKIPISVEEKAWGAIVTGQFDKTLQAILPNADAIGKVRATVTDFRMNTQDGLSFNIDQRNVDPAAAKKLSGNIDAELTRYLGMMNIPKEKVHKLISDVPHAPIDSQSVETKQAIAKTLGLNVVIMPSMPGHDAGNMSKTGVPTSMTFVRHDGVSHNPAENADAHAIEHAAQVSHGLLAKLLNIELKAA